MSKTLILVPIVRGTRDAKNAYEISLKAARSFAEVGVETALFVEKDVGKLLADWGEKNRVKLVRTKSDAINLTYQYAALINYKLLLSKLVVSLGTEEPKYHADIIFGMNECKDKIRIIEKALGLTWQINDPEMRRALESEYGEIDLLRTAFDRLVACGRALEQQVRQDLMCCDDELRSKMRAIAKRDPFEDLEYMIDMLTLKVGLGNSEDLMQEAQKVARFAQAARALHMGNLLSFNHYNFGLAPVMPSVFTHDLFSSRIASSDITRVCHINFAGDLNEGNGKEIDGMNSFGNIRFN